METEPQIEKYSLLTALSVPVFVTDHQGVVKFINPAATKYLPAKAVQKKLTVLEIYFSKKSNLSNLIKAGTSIVKRCGKEGEIILQLSVNKYHKDLIFNLQEHPSTSEAKLLLQSEEKFAKLFDNALLGIGRCELKTGRWLECNQALLNILGYTRSEFLKLTYHDITPNEYSERDQEQLNKITTQGSYGPYQKAFTRKDNNTVSVIMAGFADTLPNGEKAAWNHILDISQIDKSSQALQQAEERFKSYIENASDVFIILNEAGKYIYVAPSIKSLLGFEPDELLGRDNLEFMHPEDLSLVGETFTKALDDFGSNQRSNFRALHKNGQWVWVEVNGKFVKNYQGNVEAYLTVREKQPSRKEIEERVRKLSLVADKTTNAVLITDQRGRIEWVNSSFTEFSGYTLGEAIGKRPEELVHGPESKEIYRQKIQKNLKSGKSFRAETVNYAKDGHKYWIETFVTPIYDSSGNLTNYIAVENNISERKAHEHELSESLKLSKEQTRRLQNFGHIVSHNFRSHAANILGLIKELRANPGEAEILLQMLQKSSRNLMEALDNLGNILKVKENQELPLDDLLIDDYLDRSLQVLQGELDKAEGNLISYIPAKATVRFYPAYFESILYNLISNAIRYRSPGKKLEIIISYAEDENSTELSIADNGLGIDLKKYKNKIFEMYKTFHHHPESQGVGLYLIKNQMTALGGDILVQSAPGQGTTFTLVFPKE